MVSMRSLILAALAVPAQAVIVTEVAYVTQYAYENYEVVVDSQGRPITTNIEIVSTGTGAASISTILPEVTSTVAAPAPASHSHSESTSFNVVPVPTTSEAPTTTSSVPPPPPPPTTTSSPPPPPVTTSSPPPPPVTSSSTYVPPPPVTTSSTFVPPPPVTTSTSVAPPPVTTSSTYVPPPPVTTSSTYVPPPPVTTSSTYVPPPPVTTSTSVAPTPATTAPAPAATTSAASSGDFHGDATYYDVGLGACGWSSSDSELVAALNKDQWNAFGSMSNGNPACNKKAKIDYQGKSVTVTIVDKCPGCNYGDLDLSPAAFQQLADEGAGRISVTWSFV